MLKVKSFDISDDKGMNELLEQYFIAGGSHILVSNGKLSIPYDDGEEPSVSQRITQMKIEANGMKTERRIVVHSMEVNQSRIDYDTERVATLTADLEELKNKPNSKGKTDEIKARTAQLNAIQGNIDALENQQLQNVDELRRLDANLAAYEKQIKELG